MIVSCVGGAYLGYPNKDKYRVWVDGISPENISRAETRAMDYGGLGIQLFQVFSCVLVITTSSCMRMYK